MCRGAERRLADSSFADELREQDVALPLLHQIVKTPFPNTPSAPWGAYCESPEDLISHLYWIIDNRSCCWEISEYQEMSISMKSLDAYNTFVTGLLKLINTCSKQNNRINLTCQIYSHKQTNKTIFTGPFTHMFQFVPPAKPDAGWVVLLLHGSYYGAGWKCSACDAEP